jgi:two-component system, chemotaxis family, sensor kinase Cph1
MPGGEDARKLVRLAALRAELRELEEELGLTRPVAAEAREDLLDAAVYSLIMRFGTELISIHAPNGRYLFASPAVTALLGWTPAEMVGRDAYSLFHPDDIPTIAESHARQVDTLVQRVEYRLRRRDGSYLWVETVSRSHVVDGVVQRIVCTTRDVSERRRAAEQQEELVRRLEAFASLAAHDLKAPLQAISGLVDLVRLGAGDRLHRQEQELLDRAVERTVRLGSLVDGLLLFSRMESEPFAREPVLLRELVEGAVTELEGELRAASGSVQIDPELPTVRGDALLLGALVHNLLANAIKYRSPDRPPRVRVAGRRLGGSVALEIADNGIGIAAGDQARVFEMFARADAGRSQPGNGLGLALCRRIALHHGGDIALQSTPGVGSTFTVQLPLA